MYMYMESRQVVLRTPFTEKEWRQMWRSDLHPAREVEAGANGERSIDIYTPACAMRRTSRKLLCNPGSSAEGL